MGCWGEGRRCRGFAGPGLGLCGLAATRGAFFPIPGVLSARWPKNSCTVMAEKNQVDFLRCSCVRYCSMCCLLRSCFRGGGIEQYSTAQCSTVSTNCHVDRNLSFFCLSFFFSFVLSFFFSFFLSFFLAFSLSVFFYFVPSALRTERSIFQWSMEGKILKPHLAVC